MIPELDIIATTISIMAFAISGLTAWLTLLRRGTLKMTRPTSIFLGLTDGDSPTPKVSFRALLYSTSKKTQIADAMFARVERDNATQEFNVWYHGNKISRRGSGLYVPEHGYAADHCFAMPDNTDGFKWGKGSYKIQIFARLVGESSPIELFSERLKISDKFKKELSKPNVGVYYELASNTDRYKPAIKENPTRTNEEEHI